MAAELLFLLGLVLGPFFVLGGIAEWIGGNAYWAQLDTKAAHGDGPDGFQVPSMFMAGGFMATSFGIYALGSLLGIEESLPLQFAYSLMFLFFLWSGAFGVVVPLLALIWWPIHRIWGPRWYTMLSKKQVNLIEKEGKSLLQVGGKHPRPRAGVHLGVWYGRQITPRAPRCFPAAASGHLWASKSGIYFDPWQDKLGSHAEYRTLYTWASMKDVRVIPAYQRMRGGLKVFDPNPLNWLRGPKLVIGAAPSRQPAVTLQFTVNFRQAKFISKRINEKRGVDAAAADAK